MGKCLKFVTKDKNVSIIKDDIEIVNEIHSDDFLEYLKKLKKEAENSGKSWNEYLDEFINYKVKLQYHSSLEKLNLNTRLGKQIAESHNNFKRYFFKIEQGVIRNHSKVFDSKGQYVDWIITNSNEFFIGHGHAFLSGNSATIRNAGTAIIKEGKIVSIVNGSGHYLPRPEYLDIAINHFKEINIMANDYRLFKWKPKIK